MADLQEIITGFTTTNTTILTTSETVAIASDPITVAYETCTCLVWGWAQVTTGASTTGLTTQVRRGTDTTGSVVGEGNVVTLAAAAGGTESPVIMVQEERANVSQVQYVLTIAQALASANGTILQAAIRVMVIV